MHDLSAQYSLGWFRVIVKQIRALRIALLFLLTGTKLPCAFLPKPKTR